MTTKNVKPVVAIIGRPNVGKSTLFNRIVGRRRAITLDEPGVTHDRHYADADWDGCEFLCVDTGGIPEQLKTGLSQKVRGQIDTAIQEAAVVLLVLDGQGWILPEDRVLYRELLKSGKKLLTVVNKIDLPVHETLLGEFYSLTQELFPVSAEHGYQVAELLDKVVQILPHDEKVSGDVANNVERRIAIIGRPNVGKSSLLNHLLGTERAVVDEVPGTTRDVVDTLVPRGDTLYRLLDTAGIRRKGRWDRLERYTIQAAEEAICRAHLCLLLLDVTEGIHKQDAHIAGKIDEAGKGVILAWNKWDLLKGRAKDELYFEKVARNTLKFLDHAPQLFLSAKTGEGCGRIWSQIETLYRQCGQRVPTAALNRNFEQILNNHSAPVHGGKAVKFYYTTQTGTFPPAFVVFTNQPKGVHFSFRRYLINAFREVFQFGGAPLRLLFRHRKDRL